MSDLNIDDPYKAERMNVGNLAGFTLNFSRPGENVSVLQRSFLTSFDQKQAKMMDEAIRIFYPHDKEINNLLVVIRDEIATVYRKFPLTLMIRMKTDVEKYHVVTKNQILDIEEVIFKDTIFDLDVRDGDKFLWLFREGFKFGMYFDFSGRLKAALLPGALGKSYRNLFYYSIYSHFQEAENSSSLMKIGWFPFIQLIGDELEKLISVSAEEIDVVTESLIDSFSRDRIDSFSKYWWSNSVFLGKRKIIEAGISAFLSNTEDGFINCIKNLLIEIEGIVRLSFYSDHNKNPSMNELKNYLLEKAAQKFSTDESFGFPGLFADYLNSVIFKNFALEDGVVDFSRHSVGHGVISESAFTKARALQCILTLDQIYFYLGTSKQVLKTPRTV